MLWSRFLGLAAGEMVLFGRGQARASSISDARLQAVLDHQRRVLDLMEVELELYRARCRREDADAHDRGAD